MDDNAGTTWNPIFDNETSYSIGAIAIDPSNTNIIWVGLEKMLVGDMLVMEMEFIKAVMVKHGIIWG